MADDNDDQAQAAQAEAQRARRMSWVWWAQAPIIAVVYWFTSEAPVSERAMFVYLAMVSIIANAVSYASKQQAAEAKVASYENP